MTAPQSTVAQLLCQARLEVDDSDAALLLAHAVGQDRSWLFAHADDSVPADAASREPVAYLTGSKGFWSLDLEVTPATLIPRPETELLVEIALARIPVNTGLRVLDLGTGSGAIALAIAKERPLAQVVATDASAAALGVARGNAARNGIVNCRFRAGDWFAPLVGERFDLITSNPPYIADGDAHLAQGDLRFEPAMALSCGPDGLEAIRAIIAHASEHLIAGGWLLLEHGCDQGDAVRNLLLDASFGDVDTVQDLERRDRVSVGRHA
jgi:release factor glutamine methyltransferase